MSEEIEDKISELKGRIKEGIPKDFIAKDILYDNYCNAIDEAVEIVSNQFVELDEDEIKKIIAERDWNSCIYSDYDTEPSVTDNCVNDIAKAICAKFGRKKIDRDRLINLLKNYKELIEIDEKDIPEGFSGATTDLISLEDYGIDLDKLADTIIKELEG